MDDAGGCLGYLILIAIGIAVIAFVVWLIAQVVLIVGATMGVAGLAYGGGQACRNYGIAFKRNVIESNRA
ncbi:MAG: hypothetical protein IJ087_20520 [Eggerthellaceae bacterium]|nr:hypothetical protein [Eggerthellaceae bacterium]